MSENSFKIGDVVVLKSGGPEMTVTDNGGLRTDEVAVHWFDSQKVLHREVFDAPELAMASES